MASDAHSRTEHLIQDQLDGLTVFRGQPPESTEYEAALNGQEQRL